MDPSTNRMPNRLQAVRLPVLDVQDCQYYYRFVTKLSKRMFCAGYHSGGKDACQVSYKRYKTSIQYSFQG